MTDAAHSRRGLPRFWTLPAVRRFRRNPPALLGLTLIILLVLVALFAPLLAPVPPDYQNLRERLEPPSLTHPFGTDEFGRSMLSRTLYGARVSPFTGLVPVALAATVGTLVGLGASFYRGRTDAVLMRLMDVLLAFPSLLLALAVVGALGPGLINAVLAIAIVGIP